MKAAVVISNKGDVNKHVTCSYRDSGSNIVQ